MEAISVRTSPANWRVRSAWESKRRRSSVGPRPGCVEMCGLTATVKDGKLVGLRGTKDYPTPHKGCADRMPHHAKWLYSSEQLLHPLKRKGERGENQWEQISWDQALDEIAAKLADLEGEVRGRDPRLHRGDLPGRPLPRAEPVPPPLREPGQHRLRRHHLLTATRRPCPTPSSAAARGARRWTTAQVRRAACLQPAAHGAARLARL